MEEDRSKSLPGRAESARFQLRSRAPLELCLTKVDDDKMPWQRPGRPRRVRKGVKLLGKGRPMCTRVLGGSWWNAPLHSLFIKSGIQAPGRQNSDDTFRFSWDFGSH